MRVALVSDWFLPRAGGIETHLHGLALALRRLQVDAIVVTTTPGPDVVDDVPVHRLRTSLLPGAGIAISPRLRRRVRELLAAERVDVVHAHASVVSPVAYAGALAAADAGLPTVLTFHSMLHRLSVVLGLSERLVGWSRDRILLSAVSSVVAGQAARWMPDASVGVLPNGVDVSFWRPTGTVLPAADDEIVFVTAMRLVRKKRPLALIRAFAESTRFVGGRPPMRLVVAGDGPASDEITRYAHELGIGGRVELLGQLSRAALRDVYARAHVFVLPSERESFGIAALEARAAGLPVIAMLASGARDFISQGVDGLLARDGVELSRFISRCALDAPFRHYVTSRNRRVAPPFDWADVARLHVELYGAAAALRVGRASRSHR